MVHTAFTKPQCLYKAALYLTFTCCLPSIKVGLPNSVFKCKTECYVMWKNWEGKLWHLKVCCIRVHQRLQWEAAPNCGDQLQISKLWYLKHKRELIKTQSGYLRSSLIPISVSQEVSPVIRLQDKWSRAQIPAGARDSVLLLKVQNGSETHPSTYSLAPMVSFPCTKMVWVWN